MIVCLVCLSITALRLMDEPAEGTDPLRIMVLLLAVFAVSRMIKCAAKKFRFCMIAVLWCSFAINFLSPLLVETCECVLIFSDASTLAASSYVLAVLDVFMVVPAVIILAKFLYSKVVEFVEPKRFSSERGIHGELVL